MPLIILVVVALIFYQDFSFETRLRPLSSIEAASTSREQSARVPENTRPHSARSDWEARVKTLLKNSGKSIEELNTIIKELDQRADIPSGSPLVDRLLTAHAEAVVFEKQAGEWLSYGPNGNRARLHDITEFLSRASSYKIDNVQLLQKYADMATSLEYISEDVLSNRFPAGNDVFEEIVQWKAYAREQGLKRAIVLPLFDQLEMQMELHKAWLKDIPRYFSEHPEIIFEDVLRCTQPQDDLPPADNDFYTCICTSPVMPPPTGMISDALQCDHCLARFHGECAKNVKSCLFCDQNHWNGTIHKQHEHDTFHFCTLQTILANAPEISKNYSELYQQLEIIVRRTDRLSSIIGRFLSHTSCPERQRAEHLHLGRHYMRKLYKIPFTVSQNLGTSFGLDLAVLHATLARRPQPLAIRPIQKQPCLTFRQDTDEDWMDGTRCICRGQSAGLRGYPTVECEYCGRLYHTVCVFHPISTRHMKFVCPLCCLRKGEEYKNSDVRVIPSGRYLQKFDLYIRHLLTSRIRQPLMEFIPTSTWMSNGCWILSVKISSINTLQYPTGERSTSNLSNSNLDQHQCLRLPYQRPTGEQSQHPQCPRLATRTLARVGCRPLPERGGYTWKTGSFCVISTIQMTLTVSKRHYDTHPEGQILSTNQVFHIIPS